MDRFRAFQIGVAGGSVGRSRTPPSCRRGPGWYTSAPMNLHLVLFVVFTVLFVVGAFWAGTETRGRRFGLGLAVVVLLSMLALGAGVVWLIRSSGLS
jgi:hypothetical protein